MKRVVNDLKDVALLPGVLATGFSRKHLADECKSNHVRTFSLRLISPLKSRNT